eukprot:COSAG05_NODE_2410_length_3097_cov_1.279186_3_plen_77_part_00
MVFVWSHRALPVENFEPTAVENREGARTSSLWGFGTSESPIGMGRCRFRATGSGTIAAGLSQGEVELSSSQLPPAV